MCCDVTLSWKHRRCLILIGFLSSLISKEQRRSRNSGVSGGNSVYVCCGFNTQTTIDVTAPKSCWERGIYQRCLFTPDFRELKFCYFKSKCVHCWTRIPLSIHEFAAVKHGHIIEAFIRMCKRWRHCDRDCRCLHDIFDDIYDNYYNSIDSKIVTVFYTLFIKDRTKPKYNVRQLTHQKELIPKSVSMNDGDFFLFECYINILAFTLITMLTIASPFV